MDKCAVVAFYGYSQRNRVFGGVMRIVYRYSALAFFLFYYAGAMYLIVADGDVLVPYIAAPLASIVTSWILRRAVKRKRPYEAIKGLMVPESEALKKKKSRSFPSNHGTSASAIAFAILAQSITLGAIVFFIAVLTGLSRVAMGVHYISDVAAGFVISAAISVLVMFIV